MNAQNITASITIFASMNARKFFKNKDKFYDLGRIAGKQRENVASQAPEKSSNLGSFLYIAVRKKESNRNIIRSFPFLSLSYVKNSSCECSLDG